MYTCHQSLIKDDFSLIKYEFFIRRDDFNPIKKLFIEYPDDLYNTRIIIDIIVHNATETFLMLLKEFGFQINQELGLKLIGRFHSIKLPMLELLVDNGLNLWTKNSDPNICKINVTVGESILYFACRSGQVEIIKYIINCGISVNAMEGNAFYAICEHEKYDIIKFMIDSGLNTLYLDHALYYATKKKYLPMVKLLIRAGANISNIGSFINDNYDKNAYECLQFLLDSDTEVGDILKILC